MHEELIKKIEHECEFRNLSPKTCKQYVYHTSCFLKWMGDKPTEEFTLYDAKEYIIFKRNSGCIPATCNGINSALSFFYRRILNKIWIYDEVPRMKEDWVLPHVLSREEIIKLIDTATEVRNKAIIALIYSSGLRVGEVCRLAPSDVHMSTMQVHVRTSKNRGDHWSILSETALELLKEYWRQYPRPRDTLFVTLRSPHKPLNPGGIQIMLKKICAEAGLNAHPHTLRHSFATHLFEDDVRREYVQAMLGHRSASSTSIYLHISNKSIMGIKSPLDRKDRESGGMNDE